MCIAVPKYGNGDYYVDSIAREIYQYWADTSCDFSYRLGRNNEAGRYFDYITRSQPGSYTGATPDGRYAGETLADGTMSAAQGRDTNGPTALIRSAMTIRPDTLPSHIIERKISSVSS